MRDAVAEEPFLAACAVDPAPPSLLAPLVSPPLAGDRADGLDLILEGFLLHHGRPRNLAPLDRATAVLAGDYCYAQGLIRIARDGDLFHIRALSDLIAIGASAVAGERRRILAPLWRATTAIMAAGLCGDAPAQREQYEFALERLRSRKDGEAIELLERVAAAIAPSDELGRVLA